MQSRFSPLLLMAALVLAIALACNLPAQFTSTQPTSIPTETQPPPAIEQATQPPPTQTQPDTPTPEPTFTTTPTVIVHLMQPGDPPNANTWVSDLSSKTLANERRAIGDNFTKNLYERPFTSQDMEYQPYLDINRTELAYANPWFYVTIFLDGAPPDASTAAYAIEIDLDQDGRGDWFITAQAPPDSQWTTAGVQVWRDSNNDVGGASPINAESPSSSLDGYDELVFEQGTGADPDVAWVRRDPSTASRIQLAFKSNVIGSPSKFLWGGWSDEGVRQPDWLDYNDHFSIDQAGSPASNSSDYPLNKMASLDNTCRWTYGFEPTQPLPGLCQLKPTPTPTQPPTPCPPPPIGCPVFGSVASVWNPETCQCELP